jgi:CheY-like chemotaxis protein
MKRKKILVVDDEADVALSLKIVLEKYGFSVDTFTNPAVALQALTLNRMTC